MEIKSCGSIWFRKELKTNHNNTPLKTETEISLHFAGSGSGTEPGFDESLSCEIDVEEIRRKEELGQLQASTCNFNPFIAY